MPSALGHTQPSDVAWTCVDTSSHTSWTACRHPCENTQLWPLLTVLGKPDPVAWARVWGWGQRAGPPLGDLAEGSMGWERTVFAGRDVAALPVGGPGPPGTQVLGHGLVGAGVHTLHAPGLEAVVAACRGAETPQADPPMNAAGLRPAVLGAHGPAGGGRQC